MMHVIEQYWKYKEIEWVLLVDHFVKLIKIVRSRHSISHDALEEWCKPDNKKIISKYHRVIIVLSVPVKAKSKIIILTYHMHVMVVKTLEIKEHFLQLKQINSVKISVLVIVWLYYYQISEKILYELLHFFE